MSSDGIKRSVRSQRYDRAAGEGPSIGRVAKMPGTGLPKGERRKRRVEDGGRGSRVRNARRTIIIIWSIMLAVVAIAVLVVTIWLGIRGNAAKSDEAPLFAGLQPIEDSGSETALSLDPEMAMEITRQAIAVHDVAKVGEYFRLEQSSPSEVADFIAKLHEKDGEVSGVSYLGEFEFNGIPASGTVVDFKRDGKRRNRLAFLTPDENGNWRIDFAAFARLSSPSWEDIQARKFEVARVRVFAGRYNYFNGVFRDEQEWACYQFSSPDSSELFTAYCKRRSPQAAAMESIFKNGLQASRVTLELRNVEGALEGQYELSRVLGEDWLLSETALDEKFK